MLVSFIHRGGISSVAIYDNGSLIAKDVSRSKGNNRYSGTLKTFTKALKLLRKNLEGNVGTEVVFETASKTVASWFKGDIPTSDAYIDLFKEAYRILHSLPISYDFVYTKTPKALVYATESQRTDKIILTGLDI